MVELKKVVIEVTVKYDPAEVSVEDIVKGFEDVLYHTDGVETWEIEAKMKSSFSFMGR